jgi:1,2-phenylacetyl-CoA epoxidase PaaB subunit
VALPGHIGMRAYEVFVRHDREPQLHHGGEVQADNDQDAVIFAYTLYDERRWQDMFVVPADAIVSLIEPE